MRSITKDLDSFKSDAGYFFNCLSQGEFLKSICAVAKYHYRFLKCGISVCNFGNAKSGIREPVRYALWLSFKLLVISTHLRQEYSLRTPVSVCVDLSLGPEKLSEDCLPRPF